VKSRKLRQLANAFPAVISVVVFDYLERGIDPKRFVNTFEQLRDLALANENANATVFIFPRSPVEAAIKRRRFVPARAIAAG